jgi:CheY-like chemotaxis protein
MRAHIVENFNHLKAIYTGGGSTISIDVDIHREYCDLDAAIPCGLLINELITNTFKHARMENGTISVSISHNADDRISAITYEDGGTMTSDAPEGFGSTIIRAMANQMGLETCVVSKAPVRYEFTSKDPNLKPDKKPGKILFVEDEILITLGKIISLEKYGYSIDENVIISGEQAVEYVRNLETKPSVIVMDINLTGKIDGITAAEIIHRENYDIPVIFVTGYEISEYVDRVNAVKNSYFLPKTAETSDLKKILDGILK